MSAAELLADLARDGCALVRSVFAAEECAKLAAAIEAGLAEEAEAAGLRTQRQTLYGGRNLLRLREVRECWRRPALVTLLGEVLGGEFGLVRALYFDKPPGATWSLAWHRDRTIAVAEHRDDLGPFRCPTLKAGVPHVEAPRELVAAMLTLRIHLDPMREENGPLLVLPGSHLEDEDEPAGREGVAILSAAGDVLAMRPLLLHASRAPQPGCPLHRRLLHLEFAPSPQLPAGFRWRDFLPATIANS